MHLAQPTLESFCDQPRWGLKCRVEAREIAWAGWKHPLSLQIDQIDLNHEKGDVSLKDVSLRLSLMNLINKAGSVIRLSADQALISSPEFFPDSVNLSQLSGRYDQNEFHLAFSLDETEAKIAINFDGTRLTFDGELYHSDLSKLNARWPLPLAPKPRQWVTKNLPQGVVDKADVHLEALWGDSFKVLNVTGEIIAKGVDVYYLGKLPPITNVKGRATYTLEDFYIDAHGHADDIQVQNAKIHISKLDEKDQYIDLNLDLSSPLSSAIHFMSLKPLEFSQKLNLNAQKITGDVRTNLKLYFLLDEITELKDVDVQAHSHLEQIKLTTDIQIDNHPITLKSEFLDLVVDRHQFTLQGIGQIKGMNGQLQWQEFFDDHAALKSQYAFDGTLMPENFLSLKPYVSKAFPCQITYQKTHQNHEKWAFNGQLDRSGLKILSWEKQPGDPALFQAVFHMTPDGGWLEYLTLKGGEDCLLQLKGKEDGHIDIAPSRLGQSQFHGKMLWKPDGVRASLVADTLDLSDLLNKQGDSKSSDEQPDWNLGLSLEAKKIILAPHFQVHHSQGEFYWQNGLLKESTFQGVTSGQHPLHFRLKPINAQEQTFVLEGHDAGNLIELLSTGYDFQGGVIHMEGQKKDTGKDYEVTGRLTLEKIKVLKAPFLSRILGSLSLQGMLDLLMGQDFVFNKGDGSFVMTPKILKINKLRISNGGLGLTLMGQADYENKTVNFEGEIFPFYFINNVLANIPVLGQGLSGGSDGVFAATYYVTGSMESPDLLVNPLATVTPGVLRRAFSAVGS